MLTDEQKGQFETLGCIVLKEFLPLDQVARYRDAFEDTLTKANDGPWDKAPTRHQVLPFFKFAPEVYNHLLDDQRVGEVLADLLDEDYTFTVSEAIKHWNGTGWHHDSVAAEHHTHLKILVFLDQTRIDTGCLYVIPGSQFTPYRERMEEHGPSILQLGPNVPGAYAIETDPGDVIVFNVKCYHGAFPDGMRRGLYLNFMGKPQNEADEDYIWNVGSRGGWYTSELWENPTPQRASMLKFWEDRRDAA